ncbi:MAG: hypothetical protein JOZ62_02245 [Acidobacteriaceae bacterium]|nr:hypothetical protein [Acidobacteriaceae bacterium]
MLSSFWAVSRGYRLRPWRSPYLRWRIETYSGIPAESLTPYSFMRFLFKQRRALLEHQRWVKRMQALLEK